MVATSRLEEFLTRVEENKQRGAAASTRAQPARPASEFNRLSRHIGGELKATLAKLEKLSKLAQRKSLFDDPTAEISELSYIIKQDMNVLNSQIKTLREDLERNRTGFNSPQDLQHSTNVVSMLQSKLAASGKKFQDVLKGRNKVLQEQKERVDRLQRAPVPAAGAAAATGNSLDRFRRPTAASAVDQQNATAAPPAVNMIGAGVVSQLAVVSRESNYYQERADAVESIEVAINDVAVIFEEFTGMLAEQRELVMRIDTNVDDALANVEEAHSNIAKYYKTISSNRGLILKLFLVIVLFVVIFVTFVA